MGKAINLKKTEEKSNDKLRKIKSLSLDKTAEIIAYNFDESPSLSQVKVWLKAETKKGQMTNYEKIKSLSLDKMAKFLKDNFDMSCEIMCPYVDEHGNCTDFSDSFDCIAALKDWLKAESEED